MRQDYPENPYNQLCPYVTSIADCALVEAALAPRGIEGKLLKPGDPVRRRPKAVYRGLLAVRGALRRGGGRCGGRWQKAWAAQEAFEEACRARGREVLANLPARAAGGGDREPAVQRVRPGGVPGPAGEAAAAGGAADPMDCLDLREPDRTGDRVLQQMYWKYGQAGSCTRAHIVRDDPRLHAVYLSNFSCGPDSFLLGYFKRLMAPKPALVLEIDEHSADAGVVTRLEAFLESLSHAPAEAVGPEPPARRLPLYPAARANGHVRTWHIPWDGRTWPMPWPRRLRGAGQPAEVLPLADAQSLSLGGGTASWERVPAVHHHHGETWCGRRQRPDSTPARRRSSCRGLGPCRFGQVQHDAHVVLADLGLEEVPVVSISQDKQFYEQCRAAGRDPSRLAWLGVCASDLLTKGAAGAAAV